MTFEDVQYTTLQAVWPVICWQSLIRVSEGSLEVKLPTIWRDEKAVSREKSQKRKDQKKEDAGARKGRKVVKPYVFSWFCGFGGLKSRLAKAAGAEISREWFRSEKVQKHLRIGLLLEVEMLKKCVALWRGAHLDVKCVKNWGVEKVHAVVARSTCWSPNVHNTSATHHFWKLRCRKSARRCGAKHISKSKCTKHLCVGPLLEVEMSKKCTPLWGEANFEVVKMYKILGVWTTVGSWEFEKVHAVVARSTFRSQNVQNTSASDHLWKLRCWKSARRCGAKHISKSKCAKHLSVGRLLEVEMSKVCMPLWREAHFEVKMCKTQGVRTTFGSSDLEKVHAVVVRSTFWSQNVKNTRGSDDFWRFRCRFASLRFTTLHYITLHYTPLHSTTLHYTTLHATTLQLQLHKYTPPHSTTLHDTKLHDTTRSTIYSSVVVVVVLWRVV